MSRPLNPCPKMYLVITNISKRNNVTSLLRTAAACGCTGVFVVGQRSYDFESLVELCPSMLTSSSQSVSVVVAAPPDCLPDSWMKIVRFEKWDDCVQHLMEQSIALIGVEIHPEAINIDDFIATSHDEYPNVAFLMGNEGQGIHEKHMKSCQAFVKIPQYGDGTASLNVNVAASIVLHSQHLKHWHDRRSSTGTINE